MYRNLWCYSVLFLFTIIMSCKSDEDPVTEPPRDYAEQNLTDDTALNEFLQTHTFNYEDFPRQDSIGVKIQIDSLDESNTGKTPLSDMVLTLNVPIMNLEGDYVDSKMYYLVAQQGSELEKSASIVDSVYLNYRGILLDGSEFDKQNFPVWFDLAQVINGFRYGLQFFAPGTYSQNPNGTNFFTGYGQGLIILPSTLGYFSNTQIKIPAYSPLIFEVSVLTTKQADHDGDGILSHLEDPDGDSNPYNDDTDNDGSPNFVDSDDDGDGISTKNEYDSDNDGIPDDTDNDGVPDYLDSE